MIDQLLGRPSPTWKRTQVILVLLFWIHQIRRQGGNGPRWLRRFGRPLHGYTPWQLCVGTLVGAYALKNLTHLLGLAAPDPYARLYSSDYFRATWINTAIDAGFATAMPIKPKCLRDLFSVLFSLYYLVYSADAEEKVRKYRALSTIEFLRTTWEKQTNPIFRFFTCLLRPRMGIRKKVVLPRPFGSPYTRPVTAWLYYSEDAASLALCTELILDFPGGGFVSMTPENHEERILRWAKRTGKPILSIDYSKAPEAPYPFAIHEGLDVYRLLCHTKGLCIGMQGTDLNIVVTGDSAGANIGAAVVIKVLEMPEPIRLPLPSALVWAYPALNFNYESWMNAADLAVLRQESQGNLLSLRHQKDHLSHRSPLSIVDDKPRRRKASWSKSFSRLSLANTSRPTTPSIEKSKSTPFQLPDRESGQDHDSEDDLSLAEDEKSLARRVKYWNAEEDLHPITPTVGKSPLTIDKAPRIMQTRLTMTSRSACFNDRVLSAPMMRSMAICYIGPRNSPDLATNYLISPILAPAELLAKFPKCYLICGEKDPLSDDTIIFAGRLKEAKSARRADLEHQLASGQLPSTFSDPILNQDEFDWVEVDFIQGWSHGFLQMSALIPKVPAVLDEMADWISSAFNGARSQQSTRNHSRTSTTAFKPARTPEDEVLSFDATNSRKKHCSTVPSSTDSPREGSEHPSVTDPKLAAVVLQRLHESSSETHLQKKRPELSPAKASSDTTQVEKKERRPLAHKAAAFDASAILQRRREEAVFGLKEPISPSIDKHDSIGAKRAEEAEGYTM